MAIGQLQPTWLWIVSVVWVAWSFLRIHLPQALVLLRPSQADQASPGPWAQPAKISLADPLINSTGIALSFLLMLALLLRMPIAFWLVILSELPIWAKAAINWPLASTGKRRGEIIGGMIGSTTEALILLVIIATVDPLSTFPLRFTTSPL